jgi:hypothetical protein
MTSSILFAHLADNILFTKLYAVCKKQKIRCCRSCERSSGGTIDLILALIILEDKLKLLSILDRCKFWTT